MPTYEVRTFDVWGNEEDGFDINDVFRVGTVEIPEGGDETFRARAWNALCDQGFAQGALGEAEFEWVGDDSWMIRNASTLEPVFGLEAVRS